MSPTPVLILAYHYPPDPAAGAVRPAHFAKYLPEFGFDPTVISACPDSQRAVHAPDPVRRVNPFRPLGLAEMCLRKCLFPCDDSMLWSWSAFRAAGRILRRETIVLSTFPPLNTHLAALALKRRRGVRWVADFRDPLSGSPIRTLYAHKALFPGLALSLDARIENAVFRHADLVVANTDEVAAQWRCHHPEAADKIAGVIWNGCDSQCRLRAAPVPPRSWRELVHSGGLFLPRHPTLLLEACERLIRSGRLDPASLRLRLIGVLETGAIRNPACADRLRSLGVLEITGSPLPKADADAILTQADLLLAADVIVERAGKQLPSKIFDYIQVGRPILAITLPDSPLERVLKLSGVPSVSLYPSLPPEEIDRRLMEFLHLPNQPVEPAPEFWERFDARPRVRQLASLLSALPR